jgi:hypothetical protein
VESKEQLDELHSKSMDIEDNSSQESSKQVKTRVAMCESYVKLFYQNTHKILMEYQDPSEKKKLPTEALNQDGNTAQTSVRKESTDLSVHESNPADLTITEHLQFANNLNKKVFEPLVPKIVEQANKLFSL